MARYYVPQNLFHVNLNILNVFDLTGTVDIMHADPNKRFLRENVRRTKYAEKSTLGWFSI